MQYIYILMTKVMTVMTSQFTAYDSMNNAVLPIDQKCNRLYVGGNLYQNYNSKNM